MQLQAQIRIFGAVFAGLVYRNLIETNLTHAFAAQVFKGDGLLTEMAQCKLPEIVTAYAGFAGFEYVGLKQRVLRDTSERNAVIGKHMALAHARPEDGVNKLGVSVATIEQPIDFGNPEMDPVKIIFCLAAVDSYSHLNIMKELIELINNEVKLIGKQTTASDIVDVARVEKIETQINDFIYYNTDSLLAFYLQKINLIKDIIEAVKARLHANRNLCEDFYKLSALKVEKIAVCADIELEREADVEEVQAEIYHRIAKFL